jgi:hypothetical protein
MRTPDADALDMAAGDDFGSERRMMPRRAYVRTPRRCRARSARSGGPANPVWLAALRAAGCVAEGFGAVEPVAWSFDGARAFYTNSSPDTIVVSPFNVPVEPGQSPGSMARPATVSARQPENL